MYLLPLLGAVLWGIWYVFADEALRSVSVSTWMLISGLAAIAAAAIIHLNGNETISFKPIFENNRIFIVVLACVILAEMANLTITYALKELPSTYVAVLEVCYPLFVPIFAYLILKENQLTPSMLMGGLLILAGVMVIVFFQAKEQDKAEKLAQNEQRIVILMPAYDPLRPQILWNQWAMNFNKTISGKLKTRSKLLLAYKHGTNNPIANDAPT